MIQLQDYPEVLVLLSGGVDSAACLQIYLEMDKPISALFVDYGQPSAEAELTSARAIAKHYSIQLEETRWHGSSIKQAGFISARNVFLISVALMERPSNVSGIVIGIHDGTDYCDCTPSFIEAMQGVADIYENGAVHILAPLLDWRKIDVYEYCNVHGVPVNLTYSCEAGGPPPCGTCLSCQDRELFDAGT